ncbi:MAG: hypothetical protein ACPGU1_21050 [Myxococcota bacterium]
MTRNLPLFALCLLSLGAVGCDEGTPVALTTSACSGTSQCAGSLGCTYGYCVEPVAEQLVFRARITTPPGSPFLQQQVPQLILDDAPALTVQLVQTVELTGVVRNAGDAFVSNLPGELEARAHGEIEGMDYRFTARSSDGLDASGQGYALRLLPGRDYTVSFRPDDKALPPHTFHIAAEDLVSGNLDLTLPALGDYVKLAGWVTWPSGKPVAQCRMTVLLDAGHALPTVTLETPQSAFDLRLPPGTGSIRVRVEPPEGGTLFPTFVSEALPPSDNLEIVLPAPPESDTPLHAPLYVARIDAKGTEQPVSGANLVLAGHLATGQLTTTAMTDDMGMATVEVLPGTYDVLVASPPGQEFGTLLTSVTWEASDDSVPVHTLLVPNRVLLEGTIVDVNGELIEAGQVQARRRVDGEAGGALSISPPPFITHIDPTGRYALHLDEGTYDLTVIPNAASGAPPTQHDGLTVADATQLHVTLPPPSLARITITDPDGTPIPDVTVELYPDHTEGAQPRVLVKGTTDATGMVDLLVPHTL